MDKPKFYRILNLFLNTKDFTSFNDKNCPGNVTYKDTLILAPVQSVSLGKFCQVKICISQLKVSGILASIIEHLICMGLHVTLYNQPCENYNVGISLIIFELNST